VAGIRGCGGRSGNGFGRVILVSPDARSAWGGEESGVKRERRTLYRTDVVVGSLRRGTTRMSVEVGGRVKTREAVPWVLVCKP